MPHSGHHHTNHAARDGTVAIDPVCGMSVNLETATHRVEHAGELFHFCSSGCRTKFAQDPDKYLDGDQVDGGAAAPAGTIYTCPMHPEVRRDAPGACPICGMALEPEMLTADAAPIPNLAT